MLLDTYRKEEVFYIRLSNESKLNALSQQMVDELVLLVEEINSDQSIKVVVIKGSLKAFSVGVDINEFNNVTANEIFGLVGTNWECVSTIKVPVISQVSGFALGGGFELALMTDIIIADEGAKFGFPEINLGLMPGNGGTQRLLNLVGRSRAMSLLLTGKLIDANTALQYGIISEKVPSDELENTVDSLAQKISEKSYFSLVKIKECVSGLENDRLSVGIKLEKDNFRSLFFTSESQKNIKDFLNKKR